MILKRTFFEEGEAKPDPYGERSPTCVELLAEDEARTVWRRAQPDWMRAKPSWTTVLLASAFIYYRYNYIHLCGTHGTPHDVRTCMAHHFRVYYRRYLSYLSVVILCKTWTTGVPGNEEVILILLRLRFLSACCCFLTLILKKTSQQAHFILGNPF